MNPVRIRKHLDVPIPQLPELAPLVGKDVEIIAFEDVAGQGAVAGPTGRVQQVRVSGRIRLADETGAGFSLDLDDGYTITGTWAGEGPSPAAGMAGQRGVSNGAASFDDDGAVTRFEVSYLGPASPGDEFFSRRPRPWGQPLDRAALNVPQTPTTGLNAVWGKWPGDETEEEILAALEKGRRVKR